jgi:hypothetical protein
VEAIIQGVAWDPSRPRRPPPREPTGSARGRVGGAVPHLSLTEAQPPAATAPHGHPCGSPRAVPAVTYRYRPSSSRVRFELKIRVSAVQLRPRPPTLPTTPSGIPPPEGRSGAGTSFVQSGPGCRGRLGAAAGTHLQCRGDLEDVILLVGHPDRAGDILVTVDHADTGVAFSDAPRYGAVIVGESGSDT